MNNSPLVSVVIINFNSSEHIWKCLDFLHQQTYKNIEIIIVDNFSTDGSSEDLSQIDDSRITYHRFEKNIGSSAANNYGIKASSGDYILILNADVFLMSDYIEQSVKAFGIDPNIGTVTGKLLSDADNSIIDTTGIILYKEGVAHERGMGEKDIGQYDIEDYVVGACCASAMYKREMLNDMCFDDEYYDEDFFAFVEDLDLSVGSGLLGWSTLYTYKAYGYHVRGGSTSNVSDFVLYLNLRNSKLFFNKYLRINKKNYLYHTILEAIRYFTVDKDLRKKINKDIEELSQSQSNKHNFYKDKIDIERINKFMTKSYVVTRIVNLIC